MTQLTESAKLTENADMKKFISFKAGGSALALLEVNDKKDLAEALRFTTEKNIPHIVIGNGSNTLFKDGIYEGLVIRLGEGFANIDISSAKQDEEENNSDCVLVECGTAVLMSSLARRLLQESVTGFEFASGIPGSLGGALFMNAGAYGGEMKDLVEEVRTVSSDGAAEKIFSADEMKFRYRGSVLQENGYIATSVILRLKKGKYDEINNLMKELAARRNSKQPVSYASAGSTFKRPEGYFAGKLIEDAGLKGLTVGGAQVSTLHSGFVINLGDATATDILQLISLIQNTVYDKFGVKLEPEVRIIG